MRAPVTIALCSLLLGCGARQFGYGEDSTSGTDATDESCEPSGEELCDGLDNDCDGEIDEDIAPIACGVGRCETVVTCEDGQMPECVPGSPAMETCNLDDDDCDGEVDEGLGFGPLGETIALRLDEGSTGSCTSCRWAWGTALAPLDDGGYLALWNLGLYGGDEQPTLYGRTLDADGVPLTPVALQRDDFLINVHPIQAIAPMPMGLPLSIVYRDPGHEDVRGLMFARGDGTTEIVKPIVGQSAYNVELLVWTGERFVAGWEQDDALQLAVLTRDGALERMVDVDDPLERAARVNFGVFPGRVGVMVSRVRVEQELWDMWFIGLDAFGNVVVPTHEADVDYSTWQRLVGTEDGWLHILPRSFDEASTRQPLDLEGDPVAAATPFADNRHVDDSGLSDTFVPRPGLNEMIAVWGETEGGSIHVEFLDGYGDVLRGWSEPLPPDPGYDAGFVVSPHVTFADERVLVLWHGLSDNAEPNPVYVRAFGCVP